MRFAALSLLSLAALVAAQNQTVTVQVGGDANSPGGFFQFNPSNITASEGSVITFEFSGNPGNHSITQSSFANPCQPLSGGFDSGWVFIPQGQTDDIPTWNLTITNGSTPLWFLQTMRFAALSLLSLAALVAAQNQTVTVQVGGDANSPGGFFQFNPSNITASEGSVITFEFSGNPGNHSITQSSFANPCQPLSGGFDSGWVFIPQGQTDDIPTWNLTITNGSTPLWFL